VGETAISAEHQRKATIISFFKVYPSMLTISIQAGNYLEIVKKNPQQSSLVGIGDVSRNGYMGDDELPSMRGGGAIGKEIIASSAR
jgi:hypothetical protein